MPPRSGRPKSRSDNQVKLALAVVALLTALVGVIYKILPPAPPPDGHAPTPTPARAPTSAPATTSAPAQPTAPASSSARPAAGAGRLEGSLTSPAGNPLSQMAVGLRQGAETQTDERGTFVLDGVPAGDQTIVVKSPTINTGQLTQHINIAEGKTTNVKIILDVSTSRIGLLAVTAPVMDGELPVRWDGAAHRATIYGRADGLNQILGNFDIWVLIKSESDHRLWVQHPPAIKDPYAQTWHADVVMGSPGHPVRSNQRWDIVAVAAEPNSALRNILDTPSLSQLPPHISSNVVSAVTKTSRP